MRHRFPRGLATIAIAGRRLSLIIYGTKSSLAIADGSGMLH